jgi:uncharacterized membrane protein
MTKKILVPIFIFFAVAISFYPLAYVFGDMRMGLLASKSAQLLSDGIWKFGFYTHILLGGLALLSGCTQFLPKLRQKRLALHRNLGKVYVASVLLSGCAGFGVAFAASGGLMAQLGFGTLAILWLFTTMQAYQSIRRKNIAQHQNWMTRSYALCFGAVTLRLWMPIFLGGLGMSFEAAYPIIAWLAWVPNLAVAELIIGLRKPTFA